MTDAFSNLAEMMTEEPQGNNLIKLDEIQADPNQPRTSFDNEKLEALAASIAESGVLQPISVRESEEGAERKYTINFGERRFQAAKQAGLESIPCMIQNNFDPVNQMVENIMREDLSLSDRVRFIMSLLKDTGLEQQELATKLGVQPDYISKHRKIGSAPQYIEQAIEDGRIVSMDVAYILTVLAKKGSSAEVREFIDSYQVKKVGGLEDEEGQVTAEPEMEAEVITRKDARRFKAKVEAVKRKQEKASGGSDNEKLLVDPIEQKLTRIFKKMEGTGVEQIELIMSPDLVESFRDLDDQSMKAVLVLIEQARSGGDIEGLIRNAKLQRETILAKEAKQDDGESDTETNYETEEI